MFALLFRKIRPGRAYYGLFTQFKLEYYFASKKQKLFVPWFRSYKFILNESPWFENGICSTIAPA